MKNFLLSAIQHWKTSTAGIAGALLIIANSYQAGMNWKQWALAAAVALLGLSAHDGVVKPAAVALFVLLFGSVAMAQTPAPQPSTPIFSVSQQAVAVRIGGQTVAGSDSIGAYTLLDNSKIGMIQLQSDNILAPSINLQSYLGGVKSYPAFLSNLFAKTTLNVSPYVHAAFGIVRNVPAVGDAKQHYSVLAGTGFDWHANNTLSLGPRISYFNAPGFGASPHGMVFSAELKLVLASK